MFKFLLIIIFGLIYRLISIEPIDNRVIFFDIGQGDSTLIQYAGQNIFIDGGPSDNILHHLENVLERVIKVDILIITHFHDDHYSGALDLIERYEIKRIYIPEICDEELKKQFESLGAVEISPGVLEKEFIGDGTLALGVLKGVSGSCVSSEDYNNASIITSFDAPNKDILVMGDAEKESEYKLIRELDRWGIDKINILKAGHHCSNTSSTQVFLESIRPYLVVCSVGEDNRFGHPGDDVISRLQRLQIEYLVTWENGEIEFTL